MEFNSPSTVNLVCLNIYNTVQLKIETSIYCVGGAPTRKSAAAAAAARRCPKIGGGGGATKKSAAAARRDRRRALSSTAPVIIPFTKFHILPELFPKRKVPYYVP